MRRIKDLMNLHLCVLGIALISAGCQTSIPQHPVSKAALPNAGAPKITGLVDLGNGTMQEGAILSGKKSDERFSPGEWMLIEGKNLGMATVTIDGTEVPVEWYRGGSALIKVPAGLSPRKEHHLNLQTPQGKAEERFESSHYILTSDTDGRMLYFIRTNRKQRGGIEPEWLERKEARPMFNAVSMDGGYAFSINLAEADAARKAGLKGTHFMEIATLDLNAPNKPATAATMLIPMDSSPSEVCMNSDGVLTLLGKNSIVFLDTTDPLRPREIHRISSLGDANEITLTSVAFIKRNKVAVLLDAKNNDVYLVDLRENGPPKIVGPHRLLTDKTIPLVVHLAPDPKDDAKVWVLVSPNLRMIGSKISQTYQKLFKDKELDPSKKGAYKFLPIIIDDTLRMTERKAIDLEPGFAYHFASFHEDGKAYLTASRLDLMDFSAWKKDKSNAVGRAAKFLRDTLYFGRVIAVDTEEGKVEKVAHGAGIYMHLICVPDIGPVFSLMKFGPSLGFPFLSPKWGMGITSTGTYAKRKMNLWTIMPPYSPGCVSYQR